MGRMRLGYYPAGEGQRTGHHEGMQKDCQQKAQIIGDPVCGVPSKDFEFENDPYLVTAYQNPSAGCSDLLRT